MSHKLTTHTQPKRLDAPPMYWPICDGQTLHNDIETEAGPLKVALGNVLFALAVFVLIALGLCC